MLVQPSARRRRCRSPPPSLVTAAPAAGRAAVHLPRLRAERQPVAAVGQRRRRRLEQPRPGLRREPAARPTSPALLTPTMPVSARMETLRRATIYASRDSAVAGVAAEGARSAGQGQQGGRQRAVRRRLPDRGLPPGVAGLRVGHARGARQGAVDDAGGAGGEWRQADRRGGGAEHAAGAGDAEGAAAAAVEPSA